MVGRDLDKYMHHLDGMDMTDEEKREYIEALDTILQSIIDVILGQDPTSVAMAAARADRTAGRSRGSPKSKRHEAGAQDEDLDAIIAKIMAERGLDASGSPIPYEKSPGHAEDRKEPGRRKPEKPVGEQ